MKKEINGKVYVQVPERVQDQCEGCAAMVNNQLCDELTDGVYKWKCNGKIWEEEKMKKQKTAVELVDGRDPLQDIMEERARQDRKWGEQNHPNLYWLGILVEEVGESAKAIIEDDSENIEKELVQVAAVAVAWLECIKRKGRVQK